MAQVPWGSAGRWLCPAPYLIGLPDGPEGDPHRAHHGVPDEPLVPHLHGQAQVQSIDLTGDRKGIRLPTMKLTPSQVTPSQQPPGTTPASTCPLRPRTQVSPPHLVSGQWGAPRVIYGGEGEQQGWGSSGVPLDTHNMKSCSQEGRLPRTAMVVLLTFCTFRVT